MRAYNDQFLAVERPATHRPSSSDVRIWPSEEDKHPRPVPSLSGDRFLSDYQIPEIAASYGLSTTEVPTPLDDSETRERLWHMLTGERRVPEQREGTVEEYYGFLGAHLDRPITKEELKDILDEE